MPAAKPGVRVISIRAPLAGSDIRLHVYFDASLISIRAPLAGSDKDSVKGLALAPISIRAPLAGSDFARHHD